MKRKIGEKFMYRGKKLMVVWNPRCEGCFFESVGWPKDWKCYADRKITGACTGEHMEDYISFNLVVEGGEK